MNTFTKSAVAVAALAVSSVASAAPMKLDLTNLGGNLHDSSFFFMGNNIPVTPVDANFITGSFTEFGFSQLFATSVYDFSDGSLFGSFYDTNIPSELTFAGIPTQGLVMPNCVAGQCDIDALSPLAPPVDSDSEGFLRSWDLRVEYHFDGVLTPTGPSYTGGYFNVYFNSFIDNSYDQLVIAGALTGSTIQAANLDLFFNITYAKDGFLKIFNGVEYVDAGQAIAGGAVPTLKLDTNVNPPIPTPDQMKFVVDGNGNLNAIRQTTLDGSVTASIPEPSSIAMLGLGLLGLGFAARRKA